jgi:uncharacterized protein YndB with AHSA1/START domain
MSAMQHAEQTAEVDAPAATVFAFITDIANLPRWQSGVVTAAPTAPGPLAMGSTARVERRIMGQQVQALLRVSRLEPGRSLVLTTETSGIGVEATLTIERVRDERCRVTYGMAVEATNVFMKPMEPMVAQAAESDIAASLASLQRAFATASS